MNWAIAGVLAGIVVLDVWDAWENHKLRKKVRAKLGGDLLGYNEPQEIKEEEAFKPTRLGIRRRRSKSVVPRSASIDEGTRHDEGDSGFTGYKQ